MAKTIQVNVRIDASALTVLEAIGAAIEPKPLNRSEMINVAVKHYIACGQGGGKPKAKPKKPKE